LPETFAATICRIEETEFANVAVIVETPEVRALVRTELAM
jgi:hypothetical protein